MTTIKPKSKNLVCTFQSKILKKWEATSIETKTLSGIILCFAVLYMLLFSNHLFELLSILNTCQKEILKQKETARIGTIFLLFVALGLALICRSYKKEIENFDVKNKPDDSIIKFQNRRTEFVNELIKQLCKSENVNEYFFKEDFLKNTDFNETEFNTYNWASNYHYFAPLDTIDGKTRYRIKTENCLELYEQNKQIELAKINSNRDSKLFNITIIMMFLAFLQVIIGFQQLFSK